MGLPEIILWVMLATIAALVAGFVVYVGWVVLRALGTINKVRRYYGRLTPETRDRFRDAFTRWLAGESVRAPVLEGVGALMPKPDRKLRTAKRVLWVVAVLSLLTAAALVAIALIGTPDEPMTPGEMKGLVIGVCFAFVGGLALTSAVLLGKGKRAGWVLGLVVGVLLLPGFIILTLAGILILTLLIHAEIERLLLKVVKLLSRTPASGDSPPVSTLNAEERT